MIEYLLNEKKYDLSYSELRESYMQFVQMPDDEFMKRLPEAAHLACVISFLKEHGQWAISDIGIVHELIHLMHIPEGNTSTLRDIRTLFEHQLKLA